MKHCMKRILAAAMAVALALSVAACAPKEDGGQSLPSDGGETSSTSQLPDESQGGEEPEMPQEPDSYQEETVLWELPKSTYELLNGVFEAPPVSEEAMAKHQGANGASMGTNKDLYPTPAEMTDQGAPRGTYTSGTMENTYFFPGTTRVYGVYVPAQYDPATPAHLCVILDGQNYVGEEYPHMLYMFDNMIAAGELEPTIVLFIGHGDVGPGQPRIGTSGSALNNRGYEYDTISSENALFLTQEVIPTLLGDYNISTDPADNVICGQSSTGVAAFKAAWYCPEVFGNVYMASPTFINVRGGNIWQSMVRIADPKPIKVFGMFGKYDFNNATGDWYAANYDMASSLEYMGYNYQYFVTEGGHCAGYETVMPGALRWLYHDTELNVDHVEPLKFVYED